MGNKFVGSRRHSSNISISHQIQFRRKQKMVNATKGRDEPQHTNTSPSNARLKFNKQVLRLSNWQGKAKLSY